MQLGKCSTTDQRQPLKNAFWCIATKPLARLSVKVLLTPNELEKYSCHRMPDRRWASKSEKPNCEQVCSVRVNVLRGDKNNWELVHWKINCTDTDWWRLMWWTKQIPSSLMWISHTTRRCAWHVSWQSSQMAISHGWRCIWVFFWSHRFRKFYGETGQQLHDGFPIMHISPTRLTRFALSAIFAVSENMCAQLVVLITGGKSRKKEEKRKFFAKQIDSVK